MKLLLDTHTFLWILCEKSKFSENTMSVCSEPKNQPYVSLVSLWEIQIKNQLGKLTLDIPVSELLLTAKAKNILILNLSETHILGLESLPFHHRDPFDRLLIAQAKTEGMTFVTADGRIAEYDIEVLW